MPRGEERSVWRSLGLWSSRFTRKSRTFIAHNYRFSAGKTRSTSEPTPRQASNFLTPVRSTAPQLSIVQLPNTTLALRAQPQRRLSLTVNDWAFSATARVAILRSHDAGATLSVRHGF